MIRDVKEAGRVVILTALPVEYQAVHSYLSNLSEEVHPKGTVYERGEFLQGKRPWKVGLVEVGVGNAGTALEVERALDHFKPDLLLFIGIATGLKDVRIGDVVAATKVYGYEAGTSGITFTAQPEVGNSSYRMQQRARAEAKKADWLQYLAPYPVDQTPHVFVAPIAAGEKALTSSRSEVYRFLSSHYGDALALEREGHGFLKATHANNDQIDTLIVRGISDIIDDQTPTDKERAQELAAKHASAFAFATLAMFEPPRIRHIQAASEPSHQTSSRASRYANTFHGPVGQIIQGDHTHLTIHHSREAKESVNTGEAGKAMTPAMFEALHRALLSAFPKHEELEQMIYFKMGENLDSIAGGKNHSDVVFALIRWAESRGVLFELINAARLTNPGNVALRDFEQRYC